MECCSGDEMKKRYLYSFLFGLPGLFIAGTISIFLFGALLGVLWLFVFGDNPWPAFAETLISVLFVLVIVGLWFSFLLLGYFVGKRLEKNPALNRIHVLISVGITVLFLLLILFQQFSPGNPVPTSDSARCSEFCAAHGFSGSGMPPVNSGDRTCSCYDALGTETRRIPLPPRGSATGSPR